MPEDSIEPAHFKSMTSEVQAGRGHYSTNLVLTCRGPAALPAWGGHGGPLPHITSTSVLVATRRSCRRRPTAGRWRSAEWNGRRRQTWGYQTRDRCHRGWRSRPICPAGRQRRDGYKDRGLSRRHQRSLMGWDRSGSPGGHDRGPRSRIDGRTWRGIGYRPQRRTRRRPRRDLLLGRPRRRLWRQRRLYRAAKGRWPGGRTG